MERVVLDLAAINLPEIPVFGRYNYRAMHPALRRHCHPRGVEVCFLDRGTQSYQAQGRKHMLRGGDVFVTLPGVEHDTGGEPENPGRLYWMNVELPAPGESILLLPAEESRLLAYKLLSLPSLIFPGCAEIKQLFEEVFAVVDHADLPIRRIKAANSLVKLILLIAHCSAASSRSNLSADIARVAHLIRCNPIDHTSLPKLARLCKLSPSRFKAKFKEQMGVPPHEFILDVKIELAKPALANKSATVTEVAMDLGFNSSQYFATVFKKYTGQTPRSYDPNRSVGYRHREERPRGAVQYASDQELETVF